MNYLIVCAAIGVLVWGGLTGAALGVVLIPLGLLAAAFLFTLFAVIAERATWKGTLKAVGRGAATLLFGYFCLVAFGYAFLYYTEAMASLGRWLGAGLS